MKKIKYCILIVIVFLSLALCACDNIKSQGNVLKVNQQDIVLECVDYSQETVRITNTYPHDLLFDVLDEDMISCQRSGNNLMITGKKEGRTRITLYAGVVDDDISTAQASISISVVVKGNKPIEVAMNKLILTEEVSTYDMECRMYRYGYISCHIEDSDIVECSWSKQWEGNKIKLKITAKERGNSKIYVYYNDTNESYTYKTSPHCEIIEIIVNFKSPISIALPSMPSILYEYDYRNNIEQIYEISSITYSISKKNYDDTYTVTIYFTGRKNYDYRGAGQSTSVKIGWKLYDKNNYVVDSGTCYSPSVCKGDNWKADETIFYVIAGDYTLKILNSN